MPVRTWVLVTAQMCASKNGMAAREVERLYGLTPKTAWFVTHRIREAMKQNAPTSLLVGTIASDETWFGGDPINRHAADKDLSKMTPVKVVPGVKRSNGMTDKTPILSLVNIETGEIRSRVVNEVTGKSLRKVIAEQVDMDDSVLYTDEGSWYRQLGQEFASHQMVNHSEGEYVRGPVTINRLEGYFAQLKRSLDGTHHHVSREHLPRYLAEFDFRYSTCGMTDGERMNVLMGRAAGRRLSYKTCRWARVTYTDGILLFWRDHAKGKPVPTSTAGEANGRGTASEANGRGGHLAFRHRGSDLRQHRRRKSDTLGYHGVCWTNHYPVAAV
ncbi:MAG: IS1595 family transposase [Acidimicrobiales bacterium]